MDSIAGHFLLLRAGDLSLLLPFDGVGVAGHLEETPRPTELPGVFAAGPMDDPQYVVAPSRRLRPLAHFPAARFVVTPMDYEGREILVAWSEMKVLIAARLELNPLPEAATSLASPVSGYARVGERPAFYTDTRRMLAYMFSGAGPDD